MYAVEFYEKADGEAQLWKFLEELRKKSSSNKDVRIQFKQIAFCIELLQQNGTRVHSNIAKHLDDGIWELRPGNNRVLFFCYKHDQQDVFVLLHCFRKKTQKTPRHEIERAKAERNDYIKRKDGMT